VTPAFAAVADSLATTRFSGDPAKLLGPDADAAEEEEAEGDIDENGAPKPRRVLFSEAHRVAATVLAIERDTAVVPRGAFAVTPTHHIVPNPSFAGVSGAAAGDLAAYVHFRAASHPARADALARAGVLGADDWLDPLSEDAPEGCWGVSIDAARGVARLASLKWLGYFA
jgi:radial spoke head protein 9